MPHGRDVPKKICCSPISGEQLIQMAYKENGQHSFFFWQEKNEQLRGKMGTMSQGGSNAQARLKEREEYITSLQVSTNQQFCLGARQQQP